MCNKPALTGSLRWERTARIPGPTTDPCPLTTCHVATSPLFLNTSRDGDPTTSPGSLCQCPTTLSEKQCFLISLVLQPPHSSVALFWMHLRTGPSHSIPSPVPEVDRLVSRLCSDGTRGNGFKLKERK